MIIVPQSYKIEEADTRGNIMLRIEKAARTCYQSEPAGNREKFIRKLVQELHHESVIEHVSITVRFICDRGVANELVRHRIASYSQESTRYCNYSKNKFNNEITVIEPPGLSESAREFWIKSCEQAECAYLGMLISGASPQIARSVLPLCLKTEIVCTANLREWRHIFRLRTSSKAHPQMREIMVPLFNELKEWFSEIFDDIDPGA